MKVREILKTSGIIKATKDETLGTILNNLSSSHDAAFIFQDEKYERYMGVVTPYHTVIKSHYPPNTKAEKVLFHAPKLKPDTTLDKAAALMNESKVHYLPVFDEKARFLGIATARRIIRWLLNTKRLDVGISEILAEKRPLVKVFEDITVQEALHYFRSEKVSKLVVVDSHQHLRGVLAYFDLIPFSLFPKQRISLGDRAGDKQSAMPNAKVKNIMRQLVLTLSPEDTMRKAAELILEKEIGSVIITDRENRPVGIITTKDILNIFNRSVFKVSFSEVEIKNVKDKHLPHIKAFVQRLLKKAEKRGFTVFVWVEEEKKGGVIKMRIRVQKGKEVLYFKKEDKNLKHLLKRMDEALEELF